MLGLYFLKRFVWNQSMFFTEEFDRRSLRVTGCLLKSVAKNLMLKTIYLGVFWHCSHISENWVTFLNKWINKKACVIQTKQICQYARLWADYSHWSTKSYLLLTNRISTSPAQGILHLFIVIFLVWGGVQLMLLDSLLGRAIRP